MPPGPQPLCPLTKWKEITCGWPAPRQFNVRVHGLINFSCCFLEHRCLRARQYGVMTAAKLWEKAFVCWSIVSHPLVWRRKANLAATSHLNVGPRVHPLLIPSSVLIIDSLLSIPAAGHGVQLYLIRLISDQTSASASRRSIILIHFSPMWHSRDMSTSTFVMTHAWSTVRWRQSDGSLCFYHLCVVLRSQS